MAEAGLESGSACVYATGSVARGEANAHSDLDLFIVDAADESLGELPLTETEGVLLRADLIRAARAAGFPPFSGDGIYLQTHSVASLIARTGRPDDDYTNTFTARLLMILESRALLNESAHEAAQSRIVSSYWRDFGRNPENFLPVFLVNDIIRYWKTVCLNYESGRTLGAPTGVDADEWKARNRLRNVKLKFSRLWICHATTAHLLWLSSRGSVTPDHMHAMLRMTPVERLLAISNSGIEEKAIQDLFDLYSWFLETFSGSKEDSLEWVANQAQWQAARARGGLFADRFGDLLESLGRESPLYRFMLV